MQKSLGVSFLPLFHCLLFSTISISYSYSDFGNCVLSDSLTVLDSAQLKSEELIEELHLPNLLVATEEEEGGYHLIEGIPTLEHAKPKARVEVLQRNQCHFMGKDLHLSMKDLQNLEQQLDSALKHMRSRKNQRTYSVLQKKVRKDI